MVLPHPTMSGNVMTVWVLIKLSTGWYISEQGGIVDAVPLLVCEIWRKDVLPTANTGFARCCRQASGLGCTEMKLLLMVL